MQNRRIVKFLDADAVRERARRGEKFSTVGARRDGIGAQPDPSAPTAPISWVFSTTAVDRQRDRILGWDLANFKRSPILLWGHDAEALPLGRVLGISFVGGRLTGQAQFASADVSPFADCVRRMVLGGFISATSVGFLPLKYRMSSDPERPGGIDFDLVELLEISIVTIPANPDALVGASMKSYRAASAPTQRQRPATREQRIKNAAAIARSIAAEEFDADVLRPARVARAAAIRRDVQHLLKD